MMANQNQNQKNSGKTSEKMRVLGVDPGTRVCGYGVIDATPAGLKVVDYGVIRASAKKPLYERLNIIHQGLCEIFRRHEPGVAAVEGVFYGINVRTAIKIGEARGVALIACAAEGLEVAEYSPRTVKKSVVGTGAAHKSQVQEMVRLQLGLAELPEPDDAADALAIAICHCRRLRR